MRLGDFQTGTLPRENNETVDEIHPPPPLFAVLLIALEAWSNDAVAQSLAPDIPQGKMTIVADPNGTDISGNHLTFSVKIIGAAHSIPASGLRVGYRVASTSTESTKKCVDSTKHYGKTITSDTTSIRVERDQKCGGDAHEAIVELSSVGFAIGGAWSEFRRQMPNILNTGYRLPTMLWLTEAGKRLSYSFMTASS